MKKIVVFFEKKNELGVMSWIKIRDVTRQNLTIFKITCILYCVEHTILNLCLRISALVWIPTINSLFRRMLLTHSVWLKNTSKRRK